MQPFATAGHSHQGWLRAVEEQAGQLCHASNLFHTAPQARLAKLLVENTSWADRVFYSNSGTEAVEAVIKFARKFARVQGVHLAPADSPSSFCSVLALLTLSITLTCDGCRGLKMLCLHFVYLFLKSAFYMAFQIAAHEIVAMEVVIYVCHHL